MSAYATVEDVAARTGRILSEAEKALCATLLADAAVMIDSRAPEAFAERKKIVSCRMVLRALPMADAGVPIGATQGSISALGYSQSWTMGNGSTGELYLSKSDKQLLGLSNNIGSFSPVESLTGGSIECAALM